MPGRIRTIKPEFFTDEDVAALEPLDRIAFLGLLCYADKAGRLEYRPARLAAMILPYEQAGFGARLTNLINADFLIHYENDGRKYLQIRTFSSHQRPHHTEPESKLPSPDSDGSYGVSPCCNGETTEKTLSKNGLVGENTVSQPEILGGKGKEGRREGKGRDKRQSRPPVALDGFSDFWSRYPRKSGKGAAEQSWARLDAASRRAVMERMVSFSEEWAGRASEDLKFCPHPATWLNQRRWEDEGFVEPPPPPLTPEEIAKEEERRYWAERLKASEDEEKAERARLLAELRQSSVQGQEA